jgi:DNA-binding NarL/FixJ family response regulator
MSTLLAHPSPTDTPRIARAELVRRLRQGELRLVASDGDPVHLRPPVEIYDVPSERELEVLRLVADGLVNTEIAKRLWLSPETVKSHVSSLLGKLGAKTRAEAVAVGFRVGLLF